MRAAPEQNAVFDEPNCGPAGRGLRRGRGEAHGARGVFVEGAAGGTAAGAGRGAGAEQEAAGGAEAVERGDSAGKQCAGAPADGSAGAGRDGEREADCGRAVIGQYSVISSVLIINDDNKRFSNWACFCILDLLWQLNRMPVAVLLIAGHYAFAVFACIVVSISDCGEKK